MSDETSDSDPAVTEYRVTFVVRAQYLHAIATGPRTPENMLGVLREVHAACMEGGWTSVLLEVRLSGASLDNWEIFRVVSQRSAEGARLGRIAYVDVSSASGDKKRFAETVAMNRGVNVRLFPDVASAASWLGGA